MSMWAGTCQLIDVKVTRDKRGVVSEKETTRDVPCNVYSISNAAYYAASAAGIHPQAVLEIRACAYKGEQLVRLDGEVLEVQRAEKTRDFVKLTLVERTGDRE